MRTFTVRCEAELAETVAVRVTMAAEVEAAWWLHHRERLDAVAEAEEWSTGQLAVARRQLAVEHAGLRGAGVLRGARGPWVGPALREVLAERGWSGRRWRPVPAGARRGRPWGAGDRGWRGLVVLQLPDDVAELLVRACWWTSAPAVAKLQQFYDLWGDHWRGERHGGRRGWSGDSPSQADLAARDRATARIVTTGQVLREALQRAADTYSVGG